MSPFDNSSGCLLDGIGKYESIGIYIVNLVLQFSQFKSGNNRKYNITIRTYPADFQTPALHTCR